MRAQCVVCVCGVCVFVKDARCLCVPVTVGGGIDGSICRW